MYYVYMLRCRGDVLYTGMTPDVVHRMKCHPGVLPGGAKYTRSHPPLSLEALWRVGDKADAARKKKLTRAQKEQLIAAPDRLHDLLPHLAEITCTPLADITLEECLEGAFRNAE